LASQNIACEMLPLPIDVEDFVQWLDIEETRVI